MHTFPKESNDPSKRIKEENSSILNSSEEGDDGHGHGGSSHGGNVFTPSDDGLFPVPEGGGPYINEHGTSTVFFKFNFYDSAGKVWGKLKY